MIGGIYYFPPNGFSGIVELFNNATDGSALHLYKLWVETDAAGAYWVTRQAGSQGGTIVTSYPVVSQGATQPGQINYTTGGTIEWEQPITGFAMPAYIGATNEAGSQDTFSAGGPICVLMPGDSLRVFAPAVASNDSGSLGVTFLWAALRDVG